MKRICSLLLATLLSISLFGMALATESNSALYDDSILMQAAEPVINAYEAHYEIAKAEIENACENKNPDGGFYVDFLVTLTGQLRYSNATELPQVRGLSAALGVHCEALTTDELLLTLQTADTKDTIVNSVAVVADATVQRMDFAEANISTANQLYYADTALKEKDVAVAIADNVVFETIEFLEELEEEYIGKEYSFSIPMRILFDDNGNKVEVQYCVGDYYSNDINTVIPDPVDDMFYNGEEQAQMYISIAAEKMVASVGGAVNTFAISTPYKRVTARDYANKWTATVPEHWCSTHGWSIAQNTSNYNPAYTAYCCNDCANYVSQAFYAGGIQRDDYWKPNEKPWYGTVSMEHYFRHTQEAVNRGYATPSNMWVLSDATACNAGGVIMLYNGNGGYHVMMCVQNDTVTRAKSGHTNDELKTVYKVTSTFGASHGVKYFMFANKVDS